jgi:hypothetical protein
VKIARGIRSTGVADGATAEKRAPRHRPCVRRSAAVLPFFVAALVSVSGCVVVPQNRRSHLADPMMSVSDPRLEAYRKEKFYTSREGAAGGEGAAAGGGCGCQ